MPADASTPARPPRAFFVHLMRTGGTTLEQQLRRAFARPEVYPNPDLDFPGGDIMRHLDVSYLLALPAERLDAIRLYYGHFPYVVTELLPVPVVTFTVLRDPVERTMSLLRIMREQREGFAERTLEEIYDDANVFPRLVHDHQTKLFSMTAADRPHDYRDEITVDAGRLELAKRNLERVDVVGVTEHYGDFLAALRDRFGWQIDAGARMNAASAPEGESAALRARIAADNVIDAELYEFAKELVTARARSVR